MDNLEQLVWQFFVVQVEKNGLQGKLEEAQMISLLGLCHQEVLKEIETAAVFINQTPNKAFTQEFYRSQRDKDVNSIVSEIDSSKTQIDIGDLRNVPFTPKMWEVVKGCRVAGHYAMLDLIANYYASKWGNSIDGTFSIDAEVNKTIDKTKSSGCILLLLPFVGVFLMWVLC